MSKNIELNTQQQQVISTKDTSLLIVAGAGTGKTCVLVEKIINLLENGLEEQNILALTFTNKAADEMKNRIVTRLHRAHTPFIGTFHAFCVTLLRAYGESIGIKKKFTIADSDDTKRIVKNILKEKDVQSVAPRVIRHIIGSLKTTNAWNEFCDMDTSGSSVDGHLQGIAEDVLPLYEATLYEKDALDFDDLLIKTIQLLKEDEKVRKEVQARYAYIFVDEYQDTDPIQNTLLHMLRGEQTHIIAVGDTDQTIYSWRGADVKNMLSFCDLIKPSEVVFLTQNYRSTKNILDAANAVIAKNNMRQEKELITNKASGAPILLLQAHDEEDEARNIADNIIALHDSGVSHEDIAILFRANFQARALERQMILSNIPYTVVGARFFERAEIKNLTAYVALTQNRNNREAYTRAVQVPKRGIGAKTIEKVFANTPLPAKTAHAINMFELLLQQFNDAIKEKGLAEGLAWLVKKISYEQYVKQTFDNPAERMLEVRELIAFAKRFSHLPKEDAVAQFLSEIALGSDQDDLRHTSRGVRLMTVHAAKGLEFPFVFIAGMEEGLFPLVKDDDGMKGDTEEERRLCYVALTRAKKQVCCSFAKRRNIFGNYQDALPSSFLSDIPQTICEDITICDDGESTIHI